jgi:predicted TPR repeat methyltransferase
LRLRLLNIGGHAMSADYVRAVFDQNASKFDDALAALAYSAPQMLADAVAEVCRGTDRPARFATMLDLGCGTGLSGAAFRSMVDWMEGVDLSPAMIAQARRKNLYQKLDAGDLTESLDRHLREDARFNLVVAADVFVYCADLTLIAALIHDVLAPGGLFAFTVETHDAGGVILGPKLRYAHGEPHVRAALAGAGLTVRRLMPVSTRMEAGQPVPGLLVLAERAPASPLSPQ